MGRRSSSSTSNSICSRRRRWRRRWRAPAAAAATALATCLCFHGALGTESTCRADCSTDPRPVGPTAPSVLAQYQTHPYATANTTLTPYLPQFCQAGCAYFYSTSPTLAACDSNCDTMYRQATSVGYSDWAEKARLECRDGCGIGLKRCQPGYYCTDSHGMVLCEPGTYRNVSYEAVTACTPCPTGTYLEASGGQGLLDCKLCPPGTYLNQTGSAHATDCIRCPDGKWSLEKGAAECTCITADACIANTTSPLATSEPYIGRW